MSSTMEQIFCVKHIKLSLWTLFKKDMEGSLISTNSQMEVRFSSQLKILKGNGFLSIWAFNHPGWMCMRYQQLCTLHSTLPSKEQHKHAASTLGFLKRFRFWFLTRHLQSLKMASFYLSINVIFIILSFVVLGLCPNILFKKLWNILYITFTRGKKNI